MASRPFTPSSDTTGATPSAENLSFSQSGSFSFDLDFTNSYMFSRPMPETILS